MPVSRKVNARRLNSAAPSVLSDLLFALLLLVGCRVDMLGQVPPLSQPSGGVFVDFGQSLDQATEML
jgi:hypothetical protein